MDKALDSSERECIDAALQEFATRLRGYALVPARIG